jgi:peptide deformylase
MTLLHIVKYGDPVLRQSAEPIAEVTADLRRLVDDMIETMYAAPGIGLAAPQVGVSRRLFIIDPDYREDERASRRPRVFINPEILEESVEDDEMEEGCLSMPGINADIFRPVRIRARALDLKMRPFEVEAEGLLARVILHENDHINGRMFVDSLPKAKREALLPQLSKIKLMADADLARLAKLAGPPYPASSVKIA